MKFCKVCDNMYYLTVSDDELSQYCRNCGDTETNVSNLCIFSSEFSQSEEVNINRYTKLDPTLPRIDKMPCPNSDCETNKSKTPTEIILLRYDNTNMRYLYLCSTCDYVWKTDIKN
uniref:DNA-directed RNA polymerase M/15kDa subunit domain-containing protein n=1 Tax=viral metagenome TaxID=1070528 RepID=A0A6C0HR60_9ZZZZ